MDQTAPGGAGGPQWHRLARIMAMPRRQTRRLVLYPWPALSVKSLVMTQSNSPGPLAGRRSGAFA